MLEYFFTCVCILSPILRVYVFKEIEFTVWCLFIIVIGLIWKVWKQNGKIRVVPAMWPVILLLMSHMIYILVTGGNILAMLHYLFYTSVVFLFMPQFFDKELGFRVYRFVVLVSCAFAMVQFAVVKIAGYYISGVFPISPVYSYAQELNGGMIAAGASVRPRSFFAEPSDFGAFVGIYLLLLLLAKKKLTRKDIWGAGFVSLGLVCTISSTGILLMLVAWAGYAVKVIISNKYTRTTTILLLIMLMGGIGFLFTDIFALFAQRTFQLATQPGGTMGRISGYGVLLDVSNITVTELVLGHGLSIADKFLPGWAAILWYFGIVGILAYVSMLYSFYKKSVNKEQKYVVLLMSGMAFLLIVFFSINELFYFAVYFAYGAAIEERGESNGR